ncbi:alpha- and gamma-adaptin-binding protein p34 [Hyalella azteca]|uniref:Alpha- and gamma-adaptin-binding protein p34 n=1 Tax=Hyalella azteca TaxID=294128 RepID=A0A8B7N2Y1_HYAAZ|nr:alpha- and gamma-adaptin-binding protein p34 [Hyalella azteca]
MPGIKSKTNERPAVAILLSHAELSWQNLIKGIVNTASLPEDVKISPTFDTKFCCSWLIENKYYRADVLLMVMHQSWVEQLNHLKSIAQALIIYWDNNHDDSQQKLDVIMESLEDFQPEVCLLVCNNFSEGAKVSKLSATQWCIDHGWELVVLEQEGSDEDLDDLEDDFQESIGFHRIQGALHANRWSNMKMTAGGVPMDRSEVLTGGQDPFLGYAGLGDDDEGGAVDDFEDLFARFSEMRLTASTLSREHRLDFAENVATAFLGALGGHDDDEEDEEFNNPEEDGNVVSTCEPENTGHNISADYDALLCEAAAKEDAAQSFTEASSGNDEIPYKELTVMNSSAERLAELGFPVIESLNSDVSSPESSGQEKTEETSVPSIEWNLHDFPCKSYDDIENEIKQEELQKLAERHAAQEEILRELHELPEANKKLKL